MYCANFPSNVMADTARNRQSGSVAERRRALTVLGDNPDGCTQAILLAHGFRSQLLAELVRTKLVTEHYERVMQGGRPINVTRMRITAAGRLALQPGSHLAFLVRIQTVGPSAFEIPDAPANEAGACLLSRE